MIPVHTAILNEASGFDESWLRSILLRPKIALVTQHNLLFCKSGQKQRHQEKDEQ